LAQKWKNKPSIKMCTKGLNMNQKDREAIQMALDSIVYYAGGEDNLYGEDKDLLKTLRDRLAQEEPWVKTYCGGHSNYTTLPSPKHEWIGLTKAQFEEAVDGLEDLEDCWMAIEAKLKELNNG
jgi:hypothetical protein